MQEVFSKIIRRIEVAVKSSDNSNFTNGLLSAQDIIKQEAEQYNNGWIPCSERLPEGRQDVLVCFDNIDGCIIAWYAPNGKTWRNSSTDNICKAEPIAWMNLPTPYQSKGE